MIANYHTHTARCKHAVGMEEDYVRAAVDTGLKILGFSDHAPYPFRSHIRMAPEERDAHIAIVMALKQQYADKIEIHLGFEAECYPDSFPEFVRQLRDTPVEYLILGQHWLGSSNERYNGTATESEEDLRMYCDQLIDGIYTGAFTYLAHPDLVRYEGDEHIYRAHMRRLCKAAKQCDIPLEINLLGIQGKRHYPRSSFWELAGEEGCKAILGVDAHDPAALGNAEAEKQAIEIVRAYDLELLETVPLRKL